MYKTHALQACSKRWRLGHIVKLKVNSKVLPIVTFGGDRGIRTPHLCDANAALSLLSYIPVVCIIAHSTYSPKTGRECLTAIYSVSVLLSSIGQLLYASVAARTDGHRIVSNVRYPETFSFLMTVSE